MKKLFKIKRRLIIIALAVIVLSYVATNKRAVAHQLLKFTEMLDENGWIELGLNNEEAKDYVSSIEPHVLIPAEKLGMEVDVLKAILYGEIRLNYNWFDMVEHSLLYVKFTDKPLGPHSYGLFQINGETMHLVEDQLNDPNSNFYLGSDIAQMFPKTTEQELIAICKEPKQQAWYFVAYNLMNARWWESHSAHHSVDDPGLLATFYTRGTEDLTPHDDPKYNEAGRVADQFYRSIHIEQVSLFNQK